MFGSPRFFSVFFAIISLGMCSSSFAQSRLLLAWDLPVSSTAASVTSGFNDASVLASNITLGPSLTANANAAGWGATSWTLGGTDPFANATVNNDYIAFRVTASASDRVTITGVSRLAIQVSASGPKYWHLLYSSVNTDAAFTTPERNFGPFEVALPASSTATTDITTALNAAIAASPIVLEPTNIGYFRLVGYGGTTSAGSGRIVSSNTGVTTPDFGIMGTPAASDTSSSAILTASNAFGTTNQSATFVIARGMPVISNWPIASAITFGQALSNSVLSGGLANPTGNFTWTVPTNRPNAGTNLQSVTFNPSATNDYNAVTNTVSLVVNKASPVLTWTPSPVAGLTYPAPLS